MRQLKITKQITNREALSVDLYLHEIGKIPMVTAEMEIELAKRIREGDQIALEKLANANLRFVVSVAKQHQNQGLSLGDLINEGNVGLIKAAQRFDETRGFKFISYAVWWIRQCIMQALAEQSRVVRLPMNRIGDLNKINRTFATLEQLFQREPTHEELASVLNESIEEIAETVKWNGKQISINTALPHSEEGTLLDVTEDKTEKTPDAVLIVDSLREDIRQSLSALTEREAKVLVHYYGLDGTHPLLLEEIGARFGITRERVRQIKEKALRRLRCNGHCRILKTYL